MDIDVFDIEVNFYARYQNICCTAALLVKKTRCSFTIKITSFFDLFIFFDDPWALLQNEFILTSKGCLKIPINYATPAMRP